MPSQKKLPALLTLALSVPVMVLMASGIATKLSAPTPLIADEVPLGARVLMDVFGLIGGACSALSAVLALKGRESYARAIPMLLVLQAALLAIGIFTRYYR